MINQALYDAGIAVCQSDTASGVGEPPKQKEFATALKDERERIAKFIESRIHEPDGEGRGSKELADLVRGLP